jgi:hypothetical protein
MTLHVAPGFGAEYLPVDSTNVADIPYKNGLVLPGETQPLRPYAIMSMGSLAMVRAMAGARETVDVPLVTIPGLKFKGETTRGGNLLSRNPVAAFNYYHADAAGALEQPARLVAVQGFGYGVHPCNYGEEPTWYLRGQHMGSRTFDGNGSETSTTLLPISQVNIEHFSMARIVGGPLGDPLTDAAHRAQWGIAEIPLATVSE